MKNNGKQIVKDLYYLIPFKKAVFDLVKKIYMPPRSMYRFLVHRNLFELNIHGERLKLRHPGFHFYIENEFYWKGYDKSGFEPISRELWWKLCKRANTIFDIGANTGLYSLFASLSNPNAQIHAFEPIRRNVEKLRQNASLNKIENINVVEAAISAEDGSTLIYQPDTDVSTTSTLDAETAKERNLDLNAVEVPTVRVDSFIKEHGLDGLDLVKIDVEGFEVPVFESMSSILPTMRPTILAEIRIEEHGSHIMDLLKGCDYLFFDIDEKSTPQQVPAITKSTNNNFLICTEEVAKYLELV